MKNKSIVGIWIVGLLLVCLEMSFLVPNTQALTWTQTTQADYATGSNMTNIDIISDPGSIRVGPSPVNWKKYTGNPIISPGSPGSWDSSAVQLSNVMKDGSFYRMWYTGYDGSIYRIGYATSSDGIVWTKYPSNPIIILGTTGTWDDAGVINSAVIKEGSIFKMWYTGFDGSNMRIGYATSSDGITWTKYIGNPVLNLGASGAWDDTNIHKAAVIKDGVSLKMWYTGIDGFSNYRIGFASSVDGITWTKYVGNPVINLGAPGEWDDVQVESGCNSILYNGSYMLWYRGYDGSSHSKIGYATSSDGFTWTKYPGNPVLDLGAPGSWDDSGLDVNTVIVEGTLKMWYNGFWPGQIGYAIAGYSQAGYLESEVFDASAYGTIWNSIEWIENLPMGTDITFSTRTGNTLTPDSSWSSWSSELSTPSGSAIASPRSRYIQYRTTLTTTDANVTPILSEVIIDYDLNSANPPTLTAPATDSNTQDNIPTFTWTFSDSEGDSQMGFTVQMDDDPLFGSINYTSGDVTSSNASWTPSGAIAYGTCYWRVRTQDSYGLWSNYSSSQKLTISKESTFLEDFWWIILLLVIIVIIIIIAVLLSRKKKAKDESATPPLPPPNQHPGFPPNPPIQSANPPYPAEKLQKLEARYQKGDISKDLYEELKRKYEDEMK